MSRANFSIPIPIPAKFGGVPFGVDPSCCSLQRVKWLGYSTMKLFSKNSSLCDHDASTSQMDKQTDGQMTCHGNTVKIVAVCVHEMNAVLKAQAITNGKLAKNEILDIFMNTSISISQTNLLMLFLS